MKRKGQNDQEQGQPDPFLRCSCLLSLLLVVLRLYCLDFSSL